MAFPPELRHLTATLIFDVEDRYARGRGTRGEHPRPIGPLTYRLLGRTNGGPPEQFDPPVELRIVRNPSGYDLWFGQTRSTRTPRIVAAGTYLLRVDSRYYQPFEQRVNVPHPDVAYFVELLPGHAYPFPTETLPGGRGPTLLRGEYLRPDGTGVPGVTALVPGRTAPCMTDHFGRWVLSFPDDQPTGSLDVEFHSPDRVETAQQILVVAGQATSLRQTAVRGSAVTLAGTPIEGVTVAVAGQPSTVRSRSDGGWSYYYPIAQPPAAGAVDVSASLPDGRSQTHPNIGVRPRSTVVVPPFRL